MKSTTSAPPMRRKKPCIPASSPLPGQKAMFALNLPAPGTKKAVGRVFATEEELCAATACPVPFDDSPCCSADCNRFKVDYEKNSKGVIFLGKARCHASKLKSPKLMGLLRRAF